MSAIWRNLRIYGAVCLLVGASMYHSLSRLWDSAAKFANRPKVDDVSHIEMRFAPLRKILSANQYQRIGYLTDKPEVAEWFAEYYQTQYSLAPVVIGSSADYSVVVTNMHNSSFSESSLQDRHLSPVADYGNGVLLLKRSQ